MNPAACAQRQRAEQVERLSEDKKRLEERVRVLEAAGGPVEDMTLQVEERLQQPSCSQHVDGETTPTTSQQHPPSVLIIRDEGQLLAPH